MANMLTMDGRLVAFRLGLPNAVVTTSVDVTAILVGEPQDRGVWRTTTYACPGANSGQPMLTATIEGPAGAGRLVVRLRAHWSMGRRR